MHFEDGGIYLTDLERDRVGMLHESNPFPLERAPEIYHLAKENYDRMTEFGEIEEAEILSDIVTKLGAQFAEDDVAPGIDCAYFYIRPLEQREAVRRHTFPSQTIL